MPAETVKALKLKKDNRFNFRPFLGKQIEDGDVKILDLQEIKEWEWPLCAVTLQTTNPMATFFHQVELIKEQLNTYPKDEYIQEAEAYLFQVMGRVAGTLETFWPDIIEARNKLYQAAEKKYLAENGLVFSYDSNISNNNSKPLPIAEDKNPESLCQEEARLLVEHRDTLFKRLATLPENIPEKLPALHVRQFK